MLDETLGKRKWQDFEIPAVSQVSGVWRFYMARKAKKDQWREHETLDEATLGTAVFKHIHSPRRFRSQSDKRLAASEIVRRYGDIGNFRPFQC